MKKYSNRINRNDVIRVVVRKGERILSYALRDRGFSSIDSCISAAINRLPEAAKGILPRLTFDVTNIDRETGGSYDYKGRKI